MPLKNPKGYGKSRLLRKHSKTQYHKQWAEFLGCILRCTTRALHRRRHMTIVSTQITGNSTVCSKETSKLPVTGPLWGSTRVGNTACVSIWCLAGVGVNKAPFVNFSVSKIFDMAKVHVRFFESHPYLTGVTAAELRRHLPNINVIFNS